jgi:hypothetical protein
MQEQAREILVPPIYRKRVFIYVQHVVISTNPNGTMDAAARLHNFNGCQRQV